jgi:hypothetical protein
MKDSELLFYQTEDRQTKIDVRLEDETVWLSQVHIAGDLNCQGLLDNCSYFFK